MREAIERFFALHEQEILNDLRALVAIESVTGHAEENKAALAWFAARGRSFGMETGIARGGDSAFAECGAGGETLGVLVHSDVVGIGSAEKWRSPPFFLAEREGCLFGRGVSDDKGPVVLSLWAARAAMALAPQPRRKLRIICGSSEEGHWSDIENYLAEFGAPDYGYSPDGEFPVDFLGMGYADLELRFREPALAGLRALHAGDGPNTVPGEASLTLADGTKRSYRGVSVHSSAPAAGDNAILRLAADPANDRFAFARFLKAYFTNAGCALPLGGAPETLFGAAVEPTVASPTMLRLADGAAIVNVNIRFKYDSKPAAMKAQFDALAAQYGFRCRYTELDPAGEPCAEAPFVARMNRVYEGFGYEGGLVAGGGASYAQAVPNFVCWGPCFPGSPSGAHEENECIPKEDLLRAGCIYAQFLAEELAGAGL